MHLLEANMVQCETVGLSTYTFLNHFFQHFSSVFSSHVFDPPIAHDSFSSSTCRNPFSFQKIQLVNYELNYDRWSGSDGIKDYICWNSCSYFNVSTLWLLTRGSLLSPGAHPSTWKCAIVTPLHKGGGHHVIKNYRPICIAKSKTLKINFSNV